MITITDDISDILGYQFTGSVLLILPEERPAIRAYRSGAVWEYEFRTPRSLIGLDF